jgi:hypothetical protein
MVSRVENAELRELLARGGFDQIETGSLPARFREGREGVRPRLRVVRTEAAELTCEDLIEIHELRCRAADFFEEVGDEPPSLDSLRADLEDLPEGFTSADEGMYRGYLSPIARPTDLADESAARDARAPGRLRGGTSGMA